MEESAQPDPNPLWRENDRFDLRGCMVRDRLRLAARLEALKQAGPRPDRKALRRLEEAIARSEKVARGRRESVPVPAYPPALPISAHREEILGLLRDHQVIIVEGETGSGKTTQLPKMCLEAGLGVHGKIACTQPRRVAALSVSRRIAEELGVEWGREVGCRIRFTDHTSPWTLVKMMTDGLLLAEIQGDHDLSEYDAVIVDEAHERSLNIDFLLGYLQRIRHRRPDLRILIASATIDTEKFSAAFDGAPVVKVLGRTFPVEVRYRPLDRLLEEDGEVTHVEAAVAAAEEMIRQHGGGDLLIFMPGEADIREARDLLVGRDLPHCQVLPLFGRLSQAEQQRIFTPSPLRKIVVATNVAETSITIPGIRFVIDTGLARISRYSPNTRTLRLPVEPVSRSSADQRKGRCGRVEEGICVRLYSEKDYEDRPEFTPPEIVRSNLASVILRMKALGIGEVEDFPFLDPPPPRAIKAGYQLLRELGAMDAGGGLTQVGRRLARLPVDPTVGRMLLEARGENALREVMVIAAGLSVRDPRERPADKRSEADAIHRGFAHPQSDFLLLLNIWNACREECEGFGLGRLRKFCKSRFLSFTRMREWRDIHQQLERALREIGEYHPNEKPAGYDAIHRSVLSGLPTHVAVRADDQTYRGTRGRRAAVFPGSGLFVRKAPTPDSKRSGPEVSAYPASPEWIVAGEWVETSRLFVRTVAKIDPRWIRQLAAHLCAVTVTEPHWDAQAGRVLARERAVLNGLEISRRRVGYGKVNPEEATEIFIRMALVGEDVMESFAFLEHNREVRRRAAERQTRLRRGLMMAGEEFLYRFYRDRIERPVSSIPELFKLVREKATADPHFLFLREEDLVDRGDVSDEAAFPSTFRLGGEDLRIEYAYSPGREEDGATLRVPLEALGRLRPAMLDWLVPGHLEDRVNALLRGLPKEKRKQLIPIPGKVAELVSALRPCERRLTEALSEQIFQRYGVALYPRDWEGVEAPRHLCPRVAVEDRTGKILAAGWDLEKVGSDIRRIVESAARGESRDGGSSAWERAAGEWERHGLESWVFGDVPETVPAGEAAGIPLRAWPGLREEEDGRVSLRLFPSREDAGVATARGWFALASLEMGRDLAWLRKDLKGLGQLGPHFATLGKGPNPEESVFRLLVDHLLGEAKPLPLRESVYRARLASARQELPGLAGRCIDLLGSLFEKRRELSSGRWAAPWLKNEINALFPPGFPARITYGRLRQYPRYLQALRIRAERGRANPAKDEAKAAVIRPLVEGWIKAAPHLTQTPCGRAEMDDLRWLIEECKVSVFAPELGTPVKVSPAKIKDRLRLAKP